MKNLFTSFRICVALQVLLSASVIAQPQSAQTRSQHRIHIVLNQDKYVSGETVFIKAYFLDSIMKGVEGQQLMSVFLVDHFGTCRQTIRFNLLGGIGYNQLNLSDSLSVGTYHVIGYVSSLDAQSKGYTTVRTISVVKDNAISYRSQPADVSYDSVAAPSGPVTITAQKNIFSKREKVIVNVAAHDGEGLPVAAEFSVTILNKDLRVNKADAPIDGSIVGGDGKYFKVTQRLHDLVESEAIDQLSRLLVFQQTGKVVNAETGEPVPDNTQILFYLQRAGWYHQTFTLKGSVRLNLPQFVGSDELFYIAENPRGKIIPIKIEWNTQAIPKFKSFLPAEHSTVPDHYARFVKNRRVISQSYKTFSRDDENNGISEETDTEFDLVEPDHTYSPDKYIPFKSITEMILEVIPSMYQRGSGANGIVRITLPDPMTATADPVYFIDGWATNNTADFLALNPSDLDYIAIVKDPKKLQPLGLLGKNGMVIVKSKPGKNKQRINNDAAKLEGINRVVEFPGKVNEGSPDFRSTLYWAPTVKTDQNGLASFEFSTTDDVGEMIIQVEGITKKGQPFLCRMPIVVR